MLVPLFVQRNLVLIIVAIVITLALSAQRSRIMLWVIAVLIAGFAVASGSVSIWWNGCRPLCGEGWDVPGVVLAVGVSLAATLFSVGEIGTHRIPIWLRGGGSAILLWVLLRANLSTWVS